MMRTDLDPPAGLGPPPALAGVVLWTRVPASE